MPFLAYFTGAVLPLPVLSEARHGVGALNWLPDRDQLVRVCHHIGTRRRQLRRQP